MKVREHAKQLPKELIKDITLKSAERSLLSTHDGSHFSPKQSPEQYASDRLEEGIKWSASKGETIVSQGSKKAAKKMAEKTERVIKERRSKNADRTAEQSRNSGTQGNSQTELQTDIRIKTKEAVNKRAAGVARENIAEVKSANPLRDSANRIKQAHTAKTSKEASKLKKQAEHVYRSGKKLAVQGKKAATQSAKAAKRTVSGIKTAVKTGVTAVKSLGAFLAAGGWIVVLLVIVLGVIGGIAGSSGSSSAEPLSQEVLAYTSTIQRYASQYGISEYVPSIQAIMMQESGGRGTDPMQASECPYNTRYPNSPGAIQDPEYSIQVGVQYYADCVRQAGCESPLDISRLQLSWQGYNYGNGYIGWALEHHGGYSLENALQFSQEKAADLGWPRYGDPQYVPHVQRYYSGGGIFGGIFGNGQIVQVAKQEVGSSNGEKYWRWYGFDSYVEWCACFVSWCGEQAGLIESGAMPKFSLCENGIAWFKSHGKWQETGGIPSAGSLVFFDWNGDGISDHVGIVEKYEGGIIYTVEGNTGTNIGGNNVRGVWKHSYSVGSATILGYGII